jgi:tripartite-type tricarboxylate transporter receptor subunit TctC
MAHFARATSAAFAVIAAALSVATAEPYPTRTVTIVSPFAPGSIADSTARLIGQSLQDSLGQPFVVENKVGAGGILAATTVARAKPDGYTLLLTASSSHAATALIKNVPFDPVKDFSHIARIGNFPSFFAVNPDVPAKTIAEFVALAKSKPGELSYGQGNNFGQLVGETLKRRAGIDIVRVAYRSNPAAVADLIAGHIPAMVPDFGTGLAHVRSGKIRPLIVFTKTRSAELPDVPTANETVMPGFELLAWSGLSGPAGLPPEITATLAGAVRKALENPDVRERFRAAGIEVSWGDSETFEKFVGDQLANWTMLIKEVGILPE